MASRARQLQSCELAVCGSCIQVGPGIKKHGRRLGSVHVAGHMQRRPALGISLVNLPPLLLLLLGIDPIVGDESFQAIDVILMTGLVVFGAVPSLYNNLNLS